MSLLQSINATVELKLNNFFFFCFFLYEVALFIIVIKKRLLYVNRNQVFLQIQRIEIGTGLFIVLSIYC